MMLASPEIICIILPDGFLLLARTKEQLICLFSELITKHGNVLFSPRSKRFRLSAPFRGYSKYGKQKTPRKRLLRRLRVITIYVVVTDFF